MEHSGTFEALPDPQNPAIRATQNAFCENEPNLPPK
jgi:hypothetical protein